MWCNSAIASLRQRFHSSYYGQDVAWWAGLDILDDVLEYLLASPFAHNRIQSVEPFRFNDSLAEFMVFFLRGFNVATFNLSYAELRQRPMIANIFRLFR